MCLQRSPDNCRGSVESCRGTSMSERVFFFTAPGTLRARQDVTRRFNELPTCVRGHLYSVALYPRLGPAPRHLHRVLI